MIERNPSLKFIQMERNFQKWFKYMSEIVFLTIKIGFLSNLNDVYKHIMSFICVNIHGSSYIHIGGI